MSRRKPEKDGCEFCLGAKGGVKGNENVFGGHLACDYCTVLLLDVRREAIVRAENERQSRRAQPKKAAE